VIACCEAVHVVLAHGALPSLLEVRVLSWAENRFTDLASCNH